MSTSLSDRRQVLPANRPGETDIQANSQEASRLYQRGVAAARAGQKRVAAGFLTRSVKLDPRNENAWLWLSGVLEDPHQVAFCLNSVLKLNPSNERAIKGLRWLEDRQLLRGSPPATPLMDVRIEEPVSQRTARESGESWWVNWRQWRRDSRRVALMWWSIPVLILTLALVIHQSFAMAVERSNSVPPVLPTPIAASETADEPAPNLLVPSTYQTPLPTIAPILETQPGSIRESETIAYLDAMGPLRQDLRTAIADYRSATGKPGGSLSHVAAAQALQTDVQASYDAMQAMEPPPGMKEAHEEYMTGLEVELEAIADLLEFYGSYRLELANRAALGFQEANAHFDRARTLFDARLQQIEEANNVSSHTMR